MNKLTEDLLRELSVRLVAGLVIGISLALAGWFVGWWFFLRAGAGLTEAMLILHASAGIGGGLGAAVAWLRPDDGTRVNVLIVLLGLAGGIGGTGAGLVYTGFAPDLVSTGREGNIGVIMTAGIAANIPPPPHFIARHIRARRRLRHPGNRLHPPT